jgi:pimeloyl-ACP methyl ester carboxylesterase
MEHVISRDGTRIACDRRGAGPALVLVHGTGIDHSYWDPVVPGLERQFTLHIVDRRGRGHSGDEAPYAIQREFEDVAAVVESVPGRPFLLGHSYGALCSLEAALLTTRIAAMILNEPPMRTTVAVVYPADAREDFLADIGAGKLETGLLTLYEAGGMSPEEVALLRSLPTWQARVAAVPTMLREIESVRDYTFDPSRFEAMKTPTLLLVGGQTDEVYRAAIETLHAALPDNRLVVMPGQGHDPVITDPKDYVTEVLRFFLGDGDRESDSAGRD